MLDLDYSSSSEEDIQPTGINGRGHTPKQKRKSIGDSDPVYERANTPVRKKSVLPSFASITSIQLEKDDPAQYQGRTLARPKVQGDYPTHIYLSFDIPPFFKTLLKEAQADLPELYSLLDSPSSNQPPTDQAEQDSSKRDKEKEIELHVSLSRPLYLRADRKSTVEASLRDVVRTIKSFSLSFSTLSVFKNDDNTRTFLSIDIGAGFPELEVLTEALNKSLNKHHLPPYYTSPRFHTSIAWALLTPSSNLSPRPPKPTLIPSIQYDRSNKLDQKSFPSIEGIPPDLVEKLEKKFGDRIRKEGPWLVDEVRMKVGSEISVFPLMK